MHASILLVTLALCLAVNAAPSGYGHHGHLGHFGDRDTSLFSDRGGHPEPPRKKVPLKDDTSEATTLNEKQKKLAVSTDDYSDPNVRPSSFFESGRHGRFMGGR
jgi:hypothetical protein